MTFSGKDFESISEIDLETLVSNGLSEGVSLEFKQESYGRKDDEVKEFLKDISSFANTLGGYLLIGMSEQDGVAAHLNGVQFSDLDTEKQRFESLLRDGIHPRIIGVQLKLVQLKNGKHALLFKVPRSWNPPHQVSAKNTNRFYLRNSSGVHEASVEELRVLFSQTGTIQDRTRAYRQERLSKVNMGETPVDLAVKSGKLVVHIVPFSSFATPIQVDVEAVYNSPHGFSPIASESGYSPTINFDGFVNLRGGEQCHGYTQLFRDGRLEATKIGIIGEHNGRRSIPSHAIEKDTIQAIERYLKAMQQFSVSPPYVVMISLLGVKGTVLGVGNLFYTNENPTPIRQTDLLLPEVLIQEYGTPIDYQKALRPAFNALWNASGLPKSKYFAEDGSWTGRK